MEAWRGGAQLQLEQDGGQRHQKWKLKACTSSKRTCLDNQLWSRRNRSGSESSPDKSSNNKDQIRREKAQKSGGSLRKIKGDAQIHPNLDKSETSFAGWKE
jgi:hypothetical protein